jgi:hypothetical protein
MDAPTLVSRLLELDPTFRGSVEKMFGGIPPVEDLVEFGWAVGGVSKHDEIVSKMMPSPPDVAAPKPPKAKKPPKPKLARRATAVGPKKPTPPKAPEPVKPVTSDTVLTKRGKVGRLVRRAGTREGAAGVVVGAGAGYAAGKKQRKPEHTTIYTARTADQVLYKVDGGDVVAKSRFGVLTRTGRATRKAARHQKKLARVAEYSGAASKPLATDVTEAVGEGLSRGGQAAAQHAGDEVRRLGTQLGQNKKVRRAATAVGVGAAGMAGVKVHGDVQRGRQATATNRQADATNRLASAIAKQPVGKHDGGEIVWNGEFSKFDDDKRLAFGWASVVSLDGQPVLDKQGDLIDPDEIEKAAYQYMLVSRKGGEMHKRRTGPDGQDEPVHVADIVESFVVTPEKIEKMGLPEDMPQGWWVGYKVHDDEAWRKVKNGEYKGFSIHGRGRRTPTEV